MVILEKKVVGMTDASLARFVLRARKAAGMRNTLNVLVTSSASMRDLNSRFRNKNKSTDVLSFRHEPTIRDNHNRNGFAGEIAISSEIAAQNAITLGHTVAEEVKVLVLHGILHLAGFDHERDNGRMARKEAKLRRALKLPTALIERGQPGARSPEKKIVKKSRANGAGKRE